MANHYLKLDKNYFTTAEVRILESRENGKEFSLFYLKLLAESVSHDGKLRLSADLPYDNKTLAIVLNTDEKIVESAMKVLEEMKMVIMLEDGTIFMPKVEQLTKSNSPDAIRKRDYREGQKKDSDVT